MPEQDSKEMRKGKLLAVELRQIIQADRMAMDLLDSAEDTKKNIETNTQAETHEILAKAKEEREAMEARARAELEAELAARRASAGEGAAREKEALETKMNENRKAWVDDIVKRITTV